MDAKVRHSLHGAGQPALQEGRDFERLLDEYDFQRPERGKLIEGTVTHVDQSSLLVDIGEKRDAMVPADDLKRLDEDFVRSLSQGDSVLVYVIGRQAEGGGWLVSLDRAIEHKDWERAARLHKEGRALRLTVTGYNRGGLLVEFGALEGFVPNSHIPDLGSGRNAEEARAFKQKQVGTEILAKIIELDRVQRRLVFSARDTREQERGRRLEELEVGQVFTGKITGLADFGAFVDLGSVRGLIHISELDWRRIGHPSEVVALGEEVEVQVKKVDAERQRVGLSRKALLPSPWHSLPFSVGDLVEGVITEAHDFGAFVRLPGGLEGLLPRGEMESGAAPQAGEAVQVRISAVDPGRERIRLGLPPVDPDAAGS
jgi:small subunit ribosomal protein S1